MQNLYARSVFFVRDTPSAMEFYTNTLGFSLDWTYEEQGRPYVVQVSLLGLEIILNQTEDPTGDRPSHGRIFIGVDEDQSAALLQHVRKKAISTSYTHWGAPTMVISDADQNELFFWLPESEHAKWREVNWAPPNNQLQQTGEP
jgi:catechol 2,3-dioxygenase-like lactoylglutathione lyase family enzyme